MKGHNFEESHILEIKWSKSSVLGIFSFFSRFMIGNEEEKMVEKWKKEKELK